VLAPVQKCRLIGWALPEGLDFFFQQANRGCIVTASFLLMNNLRLSDSVGRPVSKTEPIFAWYDFALKLVSTVLFLLALVSAGCVSPARTIETSGRAKSRYPEGYLSLILAQDDQSDDLLLTLKNTSSHPITNYFPQKVFEGSVWVLQEGAVPLKTYPSNYFNLLLTSFWVNPELVIPPEGTLTYKIPLESLVCPFSMRQPGGTHPVLAYAFMDNFEVVSNIILLKHPERIQWQTRDQKGVSRFGL
jgi:hypothetical protein